MEIFEIIASLEELHPPLLYFSFFHPLPVKLKGNLIQQNWSVTIQALKLIKEPSLEHFKNPVFHLMG